MPMISGGICENVTFNCTAVRFAASPTDVNNAGVPPAQPPTEKDDLQHYSCDAICPTEGTDSESEFGTHLKWT